MRTVLKRAFTDHLGLKALSLGLAMVLFLIVRADKAARASGYVVVEYVYDTQHFVMTSKPPRQLRISVQGPWSKVNRFDDSKVAPLRLKVEGGKKQSISFQPEMIRVPRGVRVVAISPPTADVRVERLVERKVPVVPRIVGDPAPGYALKGRPQASPATVLLRGPKGAVERLHHSGLALTPLDATNATSAVSRESEVVTTLPEFTRALTSIRITVRQEVVALVGEKALSEVPVDHRGFHRAGIQVVQDIPSVGVWLRGPLPVLNRLDPKKLTLIVDLSSESKRGAALPSHVAKDVGPKDVRGLPPGVIAEKVVPPRITVRFVRGESPAPSPRSAPPRPE